MRNWLRYSTFIFAVLISSVACAQEAPVAGKKYIEGKHYTRLKAPVQSIVDTAKKVEVTEVFRFGCPACARFEKSAIEWKTKKADYVELVKNPVVWNEMTRQRAAVYYTGKALGLEQETSNAIFDAIHEKPTTPKEANSALSKEEDVLAMFVSLGADEAKAKKILKSFGIKSDVNRADGRARSFAISGTPEIFVDGRYRITTANTNNYDEMLDIASYLAAEIAKERGIIK